MKTILILICLILLNAGLVFPQVGINSDGTIPDNSAMLDVKSSNTGILIPRMTHADRSGITTPATGLMIFQTDQVSGFYFYNGTSWIPFYHTSHYAGEFFGGGIVYWIDGTGQHGLIASLVNISTSSAWSNVTNLLIGASAQSTWNGQANTNAIIGQVGQTSSAARLCDLYVNADYGTGIFTDWYLPAVEELNLLFGSRYVLNKNIETTGPAGSTIITSNLYWTSTENSATAAWLFNISHSSFHLGATDGGGLKSSTQFVRAVRAF